MRWYQRKHGFLFWAGGAYLMPLLYTHRLLLQRAALLSATSAGDQDPSVGLWLMHF